MTSYRTLEYGIIGTLCWGVISALILTFTSAFFLHPTLFVIIVIIDHIVSLSFFILLVRFVYILFVKGEYRLLKLSKKETLIHVCAIVVILLTIYDHWNELSTPHPILHDTLWLL